MAETAGETSESVRLPSAERSEYWIDRLQIRHDGKPQHFLSQGGFRLHSVETYRWNGGADELLLIFERIKP